ncbi:hypothetical protein SAVIM338S_04117 [Streptomyces avidinii]
MDTGEGAAGSPAGAGGVVEGEDAWEPLSEDVRRTLELLFDGDSDEQRGFRAQIPHALMAKSDCRCPCVYLRVDTDAVARVPMERKVDGVAGASLINAEGGYDGEATVLAGSGVMFDLQFCDWEDRGPEPLRLWEWLGPRHSMAHPADPPETGPDGRGRGRPGRRAFRPWRWPWRGLRRPGV